MGKRYLAILMALLVLAVAASRSTALPDPGSAALALADFFGQFDDDFDEGAASAEALAVVSGDLNGGMTLIREWRGTLVPSMVIHGLSNGLLMSLLWIALGV